MKRYGKIARINPEKLAEYRDFHDNVWPEVKAAIEQANVHNFSIYYKDGLLFSYYEYTGNNYEEDQAKVAKNPKMQQWTELMRTVLQPNEQDSSSDLWAEMEEVFYLE